jgi:hypothetical protein
MLRKSHYLDGPNDIDWIFRNEIDARREEQLYVDYVASDDGDRWWSPREWDAFGISPPSGAVELVRSMHRAGFSTSAGLRVGADLWNPFVPAAATPWSEVHRLSLETMERLADEMGLSADETSLRRILDSWTFPLWHVDINYIKVELNELRKKKGAWQPDIL